MRVIAGKFRGRTLKTLKGLALRPTSDRLRETLFNILGAGIEGAVFVDAYAGSGAVGIEALSRSARRVFFLEHHPPAVRLIRANLAALGAEAEAEIFAGDARRGLQRLAARGIAADIIFADPPYADARACSDVLESVEANRLLAAGGVVILEHPARRPPPEAAGPLRKARTLRQGDAALSFYRVAARR